ncbi:MAG: nucleoside-diphosphate kinase [Streptococcus mitis]|nr:nucleoside-diphosphate kinase [Streptococcus mitis]
MRISFTGDIMCELPTLRKSKIKNQYNFDGILSRSDIFGKTDYLVGNLETVLAGKNAVTSVRTINGATNPVDATPGSIRGDYALTMDSNVVHASDSVDSAAREIHLWFPEYK